MTWRNRIVGHEEVDPGQLLANPWNFRIHTQLQEQAVEGVLNEVGWVRSVLVNTTTQHIVDGHLRVSMAISKGEARVPVDYVELTEDEEKAVLAVLDPLVGLAGTDPDKQGELMAEVNATANDALQAALAQLKPVSFMARERPTSCRIVIDCENDDERSILLQRLKADGLQCRAV